MSEADLKLSYKLGRDDYWAAQARILRQGPWRIVTLAFGLWMVSAFVGSFYVMRVAPKWGIIEIAYLSLYGILGLTLLAAIFIRLVGRLTMNRALLQSGGGPLAATTIEVGNEGVSWHDGASQSWFTWSAVERIEVTDRLVLLYTSPVQAIMIPRRILGSEEAMLNFVASTREKIIAAQHRR